MSLATYNGLPCVTVGDGSRRVVVISGGDTFVRRFDEESAARTARRIGRIFPDDTTIFVLGYDVSSSGRIEELVDSVAQFMREVSGPAALAGISFGGFLALRVAGARPELVRSLILVSSARRFSDEGRSRIAQQLADVRRGDFAAMARPFVTLFRSSWLNAIARLALRLRPGAIVTRMNDATFVARMLETALACSDDPSARPISMPALVVIGGNDQFFEADALSGHAKLVTLPGETHMLGIERPAVVRETIAAFFRERDLLG